MFRNHEDVEAVLEKVEFSRKGEKTLAQLHFKIPKLSYELAASIGTDVADRLFREFDGHQNPVDNVSKIEFNEGIPVQHVSWKIAPDTPTRSIWTYVAVDGIRAQKTFKDQITWTLHFRLRFEILDSRIPGELVLERLNTSLFLTFEASPDPQMKIGEDA